MIKVERIVKSFGGVHALDSCTLTVQKKKIIALIGPNGSGKTTLFNVISRIEVEDSGSIVYDGAHFEGFEDYAVARRGISRTFQEVRLFQSLSVREHLELALSEDYERLLRGLFVPRAFDDERILKILRRVGLYVDLDALPSTLSFGQRKLLDLAMALTRKHSFLLLDEPVAGVHPEVRGKIRDILVQLKREGESILLIEHDMNFVMDLADYVYVLDHGEVIAQGKPREIRRNKKVLDAYLGGSDA